VWWIVPRSLSHGICRRQKTKASGVWKRRGTTRHLGQPGVRSTGITRARYYLPVAVAQVILYLSLCGHTWERRGVLISDAHRLDSQWSGSSDQASRLHWPWRRTTTRAFTDHGAVQLLERGDRTRQFTYYKELLKQIGTAIISLFACFIFFFIFG
jgi:hypothetical protein